jgi:hypothetical protein
VRRRLEADKERSHSQSYNQRKFHGPELPREPTRCSRNWPMRLTFSPSTSMLRGNNQKLRSRWCSEIALPRTRSTWPGSQSSLPNTHAHSCGAWLARLPLTKRTPRVQLDKPSQFPSTKRLTLHRYVMFT